MAKDRIVDRRDLPPPPESPVWAVLHRAPAGIRGVTVALCSQKGILAGLLLGIAAGLKIFPALFLLYFLR